MKPCKKCKQYKKEKDLEKYAVHLIETHGLFKSDVIKNLPVNIERFNNLWRDQRKTGQKSCEKLFGKLPKRII